jgi:hypothetical protein
MPITIHHTGSPGLKAVSFTQIAASGSVVALTIPPGVIPQRAWITLAGTGGIRYRTDGVDPNTTTGHLLTGAGSALELIGSQTIQAFRLVQNAAETPVVSYTIEV